MLYIYIDLQSEATAWNWESTLINYAKPAKWLKTWGFCAFIESIYYCLEHDKSILCLYSSHCQYFPFQLPHSRHSQELNSRPTILTIMFPFSGAKVISRQTQVRIQFLWFFPWIHLNCCQKCLFFRCWWVLLKKTDFFDFWGVSSILFQGFQNKSFRWMLKIAFRNS